MKITIENYEAFILDHLEGRLPEEQRAELFAFLEAHPELDVDLDLDMEPVMETLPGNGMDLSSLLVNDEQLPESVDLFLAKKLEGDVDDDLGDDALTRKHWEVMQKSKLDPIAVPFSEKDSMLIPNEITSQDEWFAAVLEGDITGNWKDRVFRSALAKEKLALFQKTKVKAPEISFEEKETLERGGKVLALRSFAYRAVSIAAVLVLTLGAMWFFTQDESFNARSAVINNSLNIDRDVVMTADKATSSSSIEEPNESLPVHFASSNGGKERNGAQHRNIITVSHVGARSLPVLKTEGLTASLNNDYLEVPEAMVGQDVPSIEPDKVQRLSEFVFAEAVNKVLGREKLPEESLVEALAQKVDEKTPVNLAFANKKKTDTQKGFYFRIGRFSVEK